MMTLLFLFFAFASSQEGAMEAILSQHNYYRCLHGSPFMIWDEDLQASARAWAEVRAAASCVNLPSGGPHGENMLWSHAVSRVGKQTVDAWYQNNFLGQQGQLNPQISDIIAPFNQVIWRSSLKLGCHAVTCPELQDELVVCHYDPAGNVFTDADARANMQSVTRLIPECQTIADAHEAGMFVSTETDETNPAAIAIGSGIGGITTILVGLLLFFKRESWKKWTSSKLANQQPLVLTLVEMATQITVFALMVRALQVDVPWARFSDTSTFNPGQICFQRTANSVPDASCIPYSVSAICSHEYTCNSVAAPATAIIFLILACVASWVNLVCEAIQASPKVPFDPKLVVPVAAGAVLAQVFFVWNTLWFMGGYIVSYLSLNGFAMADEGSIELIVCLPLLFPMLVICTAQMTLNTKG
jgi:hypothetical protein